MSVLASKLVENLYRKGLQLARDPVLRRWLLGAAIGRHDRPGRFLPHRPPYLDDLLPLKYSAPASTAADCFEALNGAAPSAAITLDLPGGSFTCTPGEAHRLFEQDFEDTETLLAAQRFAWVPLAMGSIEPAWVNAFWKAWVARHAEPDESWAWHPYTAAERAINILEFSARFGMPGRPSETLEILARHGPAIAERLEYFGEHHTGNHLSNNGRGLYLLGLTLGIDTYAEAGKRILLSEAARIFSRSGMLREASSHYHLLLTRNYADAWLAARRHNRAETSELQKIVQAALAAVPRLCLPGGMPLIGDISPDCPPGFLSGLEPSDDPQHGWTGLLADEDRAALQKLQQGAREAAPHQPKTDGWHRFEAGPWSMLLHAAPDGWSPMPGHGHQDVGSFELHHGRQRIFIDPGRGAYGHDGDAARYVSAAVHNSLIVDDYDPYPPNRPYFADEFRRAVGGPAPCVTHEQDGLTLRHDGFARLKGVGAVHRRFAFDDTSMRITDRVEGSSRRSITRRLHTTLDVKPDPDGVILTAGDISFRLRAGKNIGLSRATCWTAYGEGVPSTVMEFQATSDLPVETSSVLETI